MKIAFVGKGGSGKSTISALFASHLIQADKNVLAIDADINQSMAALMGAPFKNELALSKLDVRFAVQSYLRGTNDRIKDAELFVGSTPPATGSQFLFIDDKNPLIKQFATKINDRAYFMHVGTYDEKGIGESCYHDNLIVFQNVVSHSLVKKNDWLVADMVAGTDSFANAVYALFDVTFLVVEPTPESLAVFEQFKTLSQKAGTYDRLFVIANKIANDDDRDYIVKTTGEDKIVTIIQQDMGLRKLRQQGETLALRAAQHEAEMQTIEAFAVKHKQDDNVLLKQLQAIHQRYARNEFTQSVYGDLSQQIDTTFQFAPLG